jgi:hypothetical protein
MSQCAIPILCQILCQNGMQYWCQILCQYGIHYWCQILCQFGMQYWCQILCQFGIQYWCQILCQYGIQNYCQIMCQYNVPQWRQTMCQYKLDTGIEQSLHLSVCYNNKLGCYVDMYVTCCVSKYFLTEPNDGTKHYSVVKCANYNRVAGDSVQQ